MRAHGLLSASLIATLLAVASPAALAADGADWTISKSSGEVWRTGTDVQQVALKQEDILKAGDTIRTGRNGRVLLKRGEETILVAPNSVVGLSSQAKEGVATTIVQQAGSILLDVEKKNVKHFEVETPYAAAVVKGTQFRVTVGTGKTQVDVSRGQVEVANFKSGQIAQVIAGQHATAFAFGRAGISLSGSGTFSPIEQGKPRTPTVERVPVPRNGFTAPRQAILNRGNQAVSQSGANAAKPGARITSTIGNIRLNIQRVTNGLARDNSAAPSRSSRNGSNDSLLSSSQPGGSANQNNSASAPGGSISAGAVGIPAAINAPAAATSGPNEGGNDNGNNGDGRGNGGANGNGKPKPKPGSGHGNGNGNNGNGQSHGNGNNGNGNNGNGNSGNGNGHGNGNGNGKSRN